MGKEVILFVFPFEVFSISSIYSKLPLCLDCRDAAAQPAFSSVEKYITSVALCGMLDGHYVALRCDNR
jgi:hypothetical protein